MPRKPKTPCCRPGCAALTYDRFCAAHTKTERRRQDRERRSPGRNLYDRRWRKARKDYLMRHPLCEPCEAKGVQHAATVIDHIVPHRGDPVLFWDQSNWQAMAKRCHDAKTAKEDGGWGRGG